MVVASDSHSNMYGAVGCLGTPIVRTDAMAIWQSGRTWYQLAPVVRLTLAGKVPEGVTGKDIILALCALFPNDVLNHAVEINATAETLVSIPIDSRLTISNMSTEWGALSCIFPIDKTLEHWLRQKADEAALDDDSTIKKRINHQRIDELFTNPPKADREAIYAKQLYLNLSTLSPYVTGPDSVKIATPLHELAPKNIKIDRAYLVSCTNGRASDIASAARVFKDAAKASPGTKPKIADGVKLYISAASAPEQKAAEATGDWQVLVDAGAQPMLSGCAQCIGLGRGLLEAGEVSTNPTSLLKEGTDSLAPRSGSAPATATSRGAWGREVSITYCALCTPFPGKSQNSLI
jgi:homoaconitate hydratase